MAALSDSYSNISAWTEVAHPQADNVISVATPLEWLQTVNMHIIFFLAAAVGVVVAPIVIVIAVSLKHIT